VLNELVNGGFRHNEQSVRIVERLEKDGEGLNLTKEVRDGILNHEMSLHPATPEGQVVRLSDKIAYVNADIDDSIRAEILHPEDIPKEIRRTLGNSANDRLNTLVHDIIIHSQDSPEIMMSDEERDEVHVVNGKDIGLDDYRLEMHYLASYDIQGIVLDTKHIKIQTAFDKSFPVDVGIAWGEMAANRNLVNCTNGPRKMSCTYDMDEIMRKTEAKRAIRDMVSNNHLSPANKDIYDKIMRIRKGNYIRIQGYLVQFAVNDNMDSHLYEGVSSLTRTDRMSSIFDTTNTGCELIYVTSVEWLD
jgi:bifunctional DNA-binding transcriptional regulator/antitoxin component of YhaV-PrlF toxin-antitoxin module